MKLNMKPDILKLTILGAGTLGASLRTLLYAYGIDGRGLLVPNHWSLIALWFLSAAAAVILLFFGLRLTGSTVYKHCYPASLGATVGCLAAAAGIVYTILPEFGDFSSVLDILVWVLGCGAALAFVVIGICRFMRAKPYFLLHAVICVYLALRLVTKYRLWSADPQVLDYCFYLTAYVALMLTAYHHAAFDAAMGNHRLLWIFSLAGVYLSCVSLVTKQDAALLGGCALWAFTNLTDLRPRKRRQRPTMDLDTQNVPEE